MSKYRLLGASIFFYISWFFNFISLYLESNKFLKLWNNGWSTRLKGRTFPTNSFIRASSIQACLALDILLSISILLDVILDCTWEGRPEQKTGPVLWSDLGCLPAFSGWLFRLWSWSICHCKFVVFPVNKIKMIFTCTIQYYYFCKVNKVYWYWYSVNTLYHN